MAAYNENYDIGGVWLAIEDMLDGRPPREHFFHDSYGKPETRFMKWHGGSAIGNVPTLEEARAGLRQYALDSLVGERGQLVKRLSIVLKTIESLEESDNLEKFAVPLDWTPAKAGR